MAEWDDYYEKYKDSFDDGENPERVNDWPNLADAMRSSSAKVVGVECLGMLNQQQAECPTQGKDHPLNQQRSEHFVRTLLELRSKYSLGGNLILNAEAANIIPTLRNGSRTEPLKSKRGKRQDACAPARTIISKVI